ncbi:MAG: DMT family transporter [Verrucomicrobia bacterium]|nr:DMT family transporter [Verrucomicrobiota bacterium]
MRMDPRRKSLMELHTAVLLWGGTALFAKWIALPAYQITALRSVVAALALAGVLWWQRQSLALANRGDLWTLLVGGVALAAHWVTYFHSMQISTVALGILSLHTYPVMTALAEPLLFREKIEGTDVWLALIVLAGVAVLVPEWSLSNRATQGVLIGVVSAACFAARNILTRGVVKAYGGSKVTFYQLAASVGVLLPFALVLGEPVTTQAGMQLVVLGAVFTALPHTLYTNSLAHLTARSVGIIATLLPIYGALTAALLLDEVPTLRTAVGGTVILGAVAAETWRVLRRRH